MAAANIRAHPSSILAVTDSCRKMTEKIRPNTDSNDSSIDEVLALRYVCPTV